MTNDVRSFNLLAFRGKMKVLHMSWMAFFVTFVVWFNHAPLMSAIKDTLGLSKAEVSILLTLNVALAIPARIIIGMLTDKYGPRLVYAILLVACSVPCFAFALADSFVGAADRTVPARLHRRGVRSSAIPHGRRNGSQPNELGRARGRLRRWGNFGSAAAAMALPTLALLFGGDEGWRYAIGTTGVLAIVFGVLYYFNVSDTPKGSTYFKPKNLGAIEVTSKGDLYLLLVMKAPIFLALALLTWKLSSSGVDLLSATGANTVYALLLVGYIYDAWQAWRVNKGVFEAPVPALHRYKFKQVAVLNVLYFATFGSELAVISMLPLFFSDVFGLSMVQAGLLASSYAFMNLMSRPAGGLISDIFGRRRTLLILIAGLAIGYFTFALVDSSWPLVLAVITAMACSFFVQAGEGAVFAVVPLIKRRLTGQIAGMTGAYGNIGAVCYLTVFSMVGFDVFFAVIGVSAVIGFLTLFFMEEPRGHMAEVRDDGTVELIEVA